MSRASTLLLRDVWHLWLRRNPSLTETHKLKARVARLPIGRP